MIKSYILATNTSESPIAEIRTDGKNIQVLHDLSGGQIEASTHGSLSSLKNMVKRSAHLTLLTPIEHEIGKLGFFLETGDTIEITTDSLTATLNGRLMSEPEMDALMDSIAAGEVQVTHRSRYEDALPLVEELPAPEDE
jgi:hypothetical protein